MSDIISYQYGKIPSSPNKERATVHYCASEHKGRSIASDYYHFIYKSDRIRLLMKANSIDREYELDSFMRYEYNISKNRWITIFEVHSFFSERRKQLIKAYIYGHFDEKNEFVQEKLKVKQGEEIISLEKLILSEKLLPEGQ
jgi:hypothetical protein